MNAHQAIQRIRQLVTTPAETKDEFIARVRAVLAEFDKAQMPSYSKKS